MAPRQSRDLRTSTPDSERYGALARLLRLLRLLESTRGMTTGEVCTRMEIDRKTFARYRAALERAGIAVVGEAHGREKLWSVASPKAHGRIALGANQAIALLVSLHGTAFLRGTSFDEMLVDIYRQAEAALSIEKRGRVRDLERKIYNRNDDAIRAMWKPDHVSDLVTALLHDEQVRITYRSGAKDGEAPRARERPFVLEPYTLVIFRKGLYVIGYSHKRGAIRTLALDRVRSLDRLRGKRFSYPGPLEYHPAKFLRHALGIVGGSPVRVRVAFHGAHAIEAADRRNVHSTQKWETKTAPGGRRVLAMRLAPDDQEIDRWVLGFGAAAHVLEPPKLAARIAAAARGAAARYDRP